MSQEYTFPPRHSKEAEFFENRIGENFLTKKQLAEKLAISVSYVNKMLYLGLPCFRIGRSVRFVESEVMAYLKRRRHDR